MAIVTGPREKQAASKEQEMKTKFKVLWSEIKVKNKNRLLWNAAETARRQQNSLPIKKSWVVRLELVHLKLQGAYLELLAQGALLFKIMRAKNGTVFYSKQRDITLTQATLFVASVSQLDDPQDLFRSPTAPKQLPTKGGNSVNWRAIRQLSTQPIGHTNTQLLLLHQFSRERGRTKQQKASNSYKQIS